MSCNGGRVNYSVAIGLCRQCGERLLETNRIFCVSCGAVQVKLPHTEPKQRRTKKK